MQQFTEQDRLNRQKSLQTQPTLRRIGMRDYAGAGRMDHDDVQLLCEHLVMDFANNKPLVWIIEQISAISNNQKEAHVKTTELIQSVVAKHSNEQTLEG